MDMTIQKKKDFLIHAACCAVVLAAAYLFVSYLLGPLCPFIFGFLIAWLLQKPIQGLCHALRLPRRLSAFLLTLLFYGAILAAVAAAGLRITSALEQLLPRLPALYNAQIVPLLSEAFDRMQAQVQQLDPSMVAFVERLGRDVIARLNGVLSTASVSAVRLASGLVTGIPGAILAVVITVIFTWFVAMDFDRVAGFIVGLLPDGIRTTLCASIAPGLSSLRKLLLSYMLIMCMSFAELSLGFLLLRVPHAVGLALLVCVIDILPILGTGTVLIPWAIIAAVLGQFRMAAGVALLYIVMMFVRNIVEPRLVGHQIGLHPAATLLCMFVGLKLFGFGGMFGVPLSVVLYLKLRALSRQAKPA